MFSKKGFLRTKTRRWRRRMRTIVPDAYIVVRSRIVRRLTKARIIAVTGSSGKTTTVRLLSHTLSGKYRTVGAYIYNTYPDLVRLLARLRPDAEMAVFEAGATVPGSIRKIASAISPDVAIITIIAREHHSAFKTLEAIAAEKGELVAALPADGLAVLNADDPLVIGMASRTKARVVTYGSDENADYRMTSVSFTFPAPLVVDLQCAGGSYTIRSTLAGSHFAHDLAAAFAAAVELGVPPAEAASLLGDVPTVASRCEVVSVPGGPDFILDGKCPYEAVPTALAVLAAANAPRKRAIIGPVSDYKCSSAKAYSTVYKMASAVADEVIFVGPNSHRSKASQEDRDTGRFHEFATAEAVKDHIAATAVPGEVILIKGAASFHLERIGMAFRDEVRCWVDRCGYTIGCRECGLYAHPFEEHPDLHRAGKGFKVGFQQDSNPERSASGGRP